MANIKMLIFSTDIWHTFVGSNGNFSHSILNSNVNAAARKDVSSSSLNEPLNVVVHDFALQMLHFKVKHTDTNVFGSIYLRLLINDIVTKQSYPLLIMSETVLNDRKPSWEKLNGMPSEVS